MWALYTILIVTMHPDTSASTAIETGFHAILCAALLGLVVHRLTQRYRWPRPMRGVFIVAQLMAAALYSVTWYLTSALLEGSVRASHGHALRLTAGAPLVPFLITGVWMYAMVASISYATQATERASLAESLVAHTQLAALRSQINPHFLFNALHTVVQLIPHNPQQASHAAEQLAALLRTSIEETRDLLPLADEWTFVQRYLAFENMRFGDRLIVDAELSVEALDALVPSFALQTLVENAVRHGAAPRIEVTTVRIRAAVRNDVLTIAVTDDGVGADQSATARGTGLVRLRERLRVLCGDTSSLVTNSELHSGFVATLTLPARDGVAA